MLVPFFKLFLGRKITFFLCIFCETIMLFFFYLLLHKLNLLYFDIDFAQDSKNIWESDKIDVQKSICQNTFGKIDAALGVLRNFFREQQTARHMVR